MYCKDCKQNKEIAAEFMRPQRAHKNFGRHLPQKSRLLECGHEIILIDIERAYNTPATQKPFVNLRSQMKWS